MSAAPPVTTTGNNKIGGDKESVLKAVVKHAVSEEEKQACLNTAIYALTKQYSFYGSILQIMNLNYSYMVPTAGVGFNADMKRYEMHLNPVFFCKAMNDKQRIAVLLHEIMHITHQHLIRVPFLKVSNHKRILLNCAGDLSINQVIHNLPRGCPECPPLEEQQKGKHCKNELCCGFALDIKDYHDTDEKTGKKIQWPANKTMEFYFQKLMERYEEPEEEKKEKRFALIAVSDVNLDVTASGVKSGKTLTFNAPGLQKIGGKSLVKDKNFLVKDQTALEDNGVYVCKDIGSPTTNAVLERHPNHNGAGNGQVTLGDLAAETDQKSKAKMTGWIVEGKQRSTKDKTVNVDVSPMTWKEVEMKASQGGKGLSQDGDGDGEGIQGSPGQGNTPRQFDSHDWGSGADENDVLDATEDLVKRAMTKQNMSYDDAPGHVKELLDDIKSRRAELNYKALILAAIKRSATGSDRRSTWTRKSRRYGNKAPGTREGELPKLHLYLDTSGSISWEELQSFLGVVDEFLKVGARKCEVNLFSDNNYFNDRYKLGDRAFHDKLKKKLSIGGTCLSSSLAQILNKKGDLNIFVTDGYYGNVEVEKWLKPGQKFPQTLFVISDGGTVDHPLQRLGPTVKICKGKTADGKK